MVASVPTSITAKMVWTSGRLFVRITPTAWMCAARVTAKKPFRFFFTFTSTYVLCLFLFVPPLAFTLTKQRAVQHFRMGVHRAMWAGQALRLNRRIAVPMLCVWTSAARVLSLCLAFLQQGMGFRVLAIDRAHTLIEQGRCEGMRKRPGEVAPIC